MTRAQINVQAAVTRLEVIDILPDRMIVELEAEVHVGGKVFPFTKIQEVDLPEDWLGDDDDADWWKE